MQSHRNKPNKVPKVSAVYTPVRLVCVFFHKSIVNIAVAASNKLCAVVGKIRYFNYFPQHIFVVQTQITKKNVSSIGVVVVVAVVVGTGTKTK